MEGLGRRAPTTLRILNVCCDCKGLGFVIVAGRPMNWGLLTVLIPHTHPA